MTNIVNFEEELKSNESLTNIILENSLRINDAKFNGALKEDELAKEIMMVSRLFANQVKLGKKTEEDVDSFEAEIPSGAYYFSNVHKYLKEAGSYAKEANTDALMQREVWEKQSKPVENHIKGLIRM